MLPWPVGDGNWVSLNSVDAVSRLLCRSSKLTEGRKSSESDVSTFDVAVAFAFRPNEKSEWLLEDEAWSIGSLVVETAVEAAFEFCLRLQQSAEGQRWGLKTHTPKGTRNW